jgi:NAD dependent epimerase/dehydratase family enzyme
MTTGQKVAPAVAMRKGYRFQYPQLEGALANVLANANGDK